MVDQNDLNYIARTAFRDIADQDYITARWGYKSRLSIQFCGSTMYREVFKSNIVI